MIVLFFTVWNQYYFCLAKKLEKSAEQSFAILSRKIFLFSKLKLGPAQDTAPLGGTGDSTVGVANHSQYGTRSADGGPSLHLARIVLGERSGGFLVC